MYSYLAALLKGGGNPYHGADGKFSSGPGGGGKPSGGGGASSWRDWKPNSKTGERMKAFGETYHASLKGQGHSDKDADAKVDSLIQQMRATGDPEKLKTLVNETVKAGKLDPKVHSALQAVVAKQPPAKFERPAPKPASPAADSGFSEEKHQARRARAKAAMLEDGIKEEDAEEVLSDTDQDPLYMRQMHHQESLDLPPKLFHAIDSYSQSAILRAGKTLPTEADRATYSSSNYEGKGKRHKSGTKY